jgi:hypothetical protein
MTAPNPIPAGPDLDARRQSNEPASRPSLPKAWSATVLLSPFGDSISPLPNYSQLAVGAIEASCTGSEDWMRARIYLTQSNRYFDFVFTTNRAPTSLQICQRSKAACRTQANR